MQGTDGTTAVADSATLDITRPTITLDATGHIILDQPAVEFASVYGMKGLYLGLPRYYGANATSVSP